MIKAVLFDVDGTIFDTETLYAMYLRKSSKSLEYPVSDDYLNRMRGKNVPAYKEAFVAEIGTPEQFETWIDLHYKMMNEHILTKGVPSMKGIKELVAWLKGVDVKKAIVTSSPADQIPIYFAKADVEYIFDDAITGDDITKGKPDPEIYLSMAKRLGVDPSECIVLEDSRNGILSALNAGCNVIIIPDAERPEEDVCARAFAVCDNAFEAMDLLKEQFRFN